MSAPPPIPAATYHPDAGGDPQAPADVAVMTVTILRPSLAEALASICRQSFTGRIQLVIGVDVARGEPDILARVLAERPAHVSALVLHLPYSTALRNGGLHTPNDGGALRTMLSAAANARHLAQLDDDNTWLPDHLERLLAAIPGRAYAFSQRMLVDEETDRDLGVDIWDSVGPGAGRLAPIGGFVDPNCLLIDKLEAARALGGYADTWDRRPGWSADRTLFAAIADRPHARVEAATVRYRIRRTNVMWRFLVDLKRRGGLQGFDWSLDEAPAGAL